ncbi:MAG: carbamoyltransferase [Candidatus Melainabacteria bacterium]
MPKYILGISAYYHDSAAALIADGQIIAAAQEERFTRKKHDPGFPAEAVKYCLKEAGIRLTDLEAIVFYDKPLLKFERLLETYLSYAPQGFQSFVMAMPVWLKEKLFLKDTLKKELCKLGGLTTRDEKKHLPKLLFGEHHQSHAASAFFPSPYEEAAVMCLDGVGEWSTTSVWHGKGNELKPLWEIHFPHSLGLLYSAFTYYTGFKVNSGEYKLMGLAPYGEPKYVDTIKDNLIDLKEDGTFRLRMEYFNYATGLTMTNKKFDALFGGPPRKAESELTQREMDIARSIQVVTEEIVLKLAETVQKETGLNTLCLAGGVALNCVANGKLIKNGAFEHIWIQPAAGDAGGALGAALAAWHGYYDAPRSVASANPKEELDAMQGGYLGPRFSDAEVRKALDDLGATYVRLEDASLIPELAGLLGDEKVVGWFQGRMEFGPRALGGRSILGDPRSQKMQTVMNLKIKFRESFRPFAPSVLRERVEDIFEFDRVSPYMLVTAPVKESVRIAMSEADQQRFGIDKLKVTRSSVPAITHVDYSARIQTVDKATNPRYHALLSAFEAQSGCPVVVNTSFNVRGEPIVCTPEDAYRCFMRTDMDALVVENYLMLKPSQPQSLVEKYRDKSWQEEFALD